MQTSPVNESRHEIYDWLRGLASISVVLGHFKPFDISKSYFLWSVQVFVLVTLALLSQSSFDASKFWRRLFYLAFVYVCNAALFWLIHFSMSDPAQIPLTTLLFNPKVAFLQNPYFDQLWYLVLYVQILLFLLFFGRRLNQIPADKALLGTLVLSQIVFFVTYFVFEKFRTISIFSWCFVIAVGWYSLPRVLKLIEQSKEFRFTRCLAAILVFSLFLSHPEIRAWTQISETRTYIFNTILFFIAIYFIAETFYLIRKYAFFTPFKEAVFTVSRYTLIIYIYHQGIRQLVYPRGTDAFLWAFFAIVSGVFIGYVMHSAYLFLEEGIMRRASKKTLPRGNSPEKLASAS